MGLKEIFSRKSSSQGSQDSYRSEQEASDETRSQDDSPVRTDELPEAKCRFCYEGFKSGDEAYKCEKCDTYYHFPTCLKNQTNCRVCGEKVVETGNIVTLIKSKFVRCPKCKEKLKLNYSLEDKVHVSCQTCGSEGKIPNPYLKSEVDEDKEIKDKTEEQVGDLKPGAAEESEGEEVIKPGDMELRKPKLVILEESITCHVCLGTIKTGLPVVVCRCGKKYHESCANRVGYCPICEADLTDYEPVSDLVKDRSEKFREPVSKPEQQMEQEVGPEPEEPVEVETTTEPESEPEPEPKPEPEPIAADITELEPEPEPEPEPIAADITEPEPEPEDAWDLDPNYTFDNFITDNQNRIVHSIARGIAEAPGNEVKLFYMYGQEGIGKTHLLQAIGNFIENNKSDLKIKYAPAENFFTEIDQALKGGKQKQFVDDIKTTDVILLDDLKGISEDGKSKKMIEKIFQNFLKDNKQIVITGDQPIEAIKVIEKNLSKFFKDGLIIKLNEPSDELRKQIRKKKLLEDLIEKSADDGIEDIDELKKELAEYLKSKK